MAWVRYFFVGLRARVPPGKPGFLLGDRLETPAADVGDDRIGHDAQRVIGGGRGLFTGHDDHLVLPAGVQELAEIGHDLFEVPERVCGGFQRVGAIGDEQEIGVEFGQGFGAHALEFAFGDRFDPLGKAKPASRSTRPRPP